MPRRALYTRIHARLEKCSSVCVCIRGTWNVNTKKRRIYLCAQILMMSPIQLLCERTRRRRIEPDAIHLRALCHLWACFHSVAFFFAAAICVRVKLALHFLMRHICPFQWKRPKRVAQRGKTPSHTAVMPDSLFFKFLRNIDWVCRLCWAKKEILHAWVAKGWTPLGCGSLFGTFNISKTSCWVFWPSNYNCLAEIPSEHTALNDIQMANFNSIS